jgi:hypothetical protein
MAGGSAVPAAPTPLGESAVAPVAKPEPAGAGVMMVLRHPHHEGAKVLVYGDGTVAVQDVSGNTSRRQKFDPSQFVATGWGIPSDEEDPNGKPAKKK